MARIKFYLDSRKSKNGEGLLVIKITHRNTTAFLSTDTKLRLDQWDDDRQVCVNHPNTKNVNSFLAIRMSAIQNTINILGINGGLEKMSASDIKNQYLESIGVIKSSKKTNNFVSYYNRYASEKRKDGTRSLYGLAMKQMEAYDSGLASKAFEDLTKDWMIGFQNYLLQRLKVNTVSIYLRCVRAVFNSAIDDEITTYYPFRKMQIKSAATKDRSLTAEELRTLFNYPCDDWQREYVDIFKLMFMLVGINIGDLSLLDGIYSGRIEYDRQKTGKHYSIKVEPEAMEIIKKYKGKKNLLSILDRYENYSDYNKHLNNALKKIGMSCHWGRRYEGTPLFPGISSYYSRYSWATIAAELDIPKDVIAAALGHTRMDVTQIYIRADMKKKIDSANRKVLDYVLKGIAV